MGITVASSELSRWLILTGYARVQMRSSELGLMFSDQDSSRLVKPNML